MKKNSIRLIVLMAFALPVVLMSSCRKEDPDELEENYVCDGVEYIKDFWLRSNQEGKTEAAIGFIIEKSNPAARGIAVPNLEEARRQFRNLFIPLEAKVTEEGGNMTVSLTDKEGVEKNKLFFTVVNDGVTFATVTLEKKDADLENIVSEVRFVSRDDMYYGTIAGDGCPYRLGNIYKHSYDGYSYLCVREPGIDKTPGFLVCDKDIYYKLWTNTLAGSANETANMPRVYDFPRIHDALQVEVSDIVSAQLWQGLVATTQAKKDGKFTHSVRDLKQRVYWMNWQPKNNEVTGIYCLSNGGQDLLEPGYWWWEDDTYEWVLSAYELYYDDDNKFNIRRCASRGSYTKNVVDEYPSKDSFVLNETLTQEAQSVRLQ